MNKLTYVQATCCGEMKSRSSNSYNLVDVASVSVHTLDSSITRTLFQISELEKVKMITTYVFTALVMCVNSALITTPLKEISQKTPPEENRLNELTASKVAEHIHTSYDASCAVKLVIGNDQSATDFTTNFATKLDNDSSSRNTLSVFTLDTNLTFKNPIHDQFIKWRADCVINVLIIHTNSTKMLRDMTDFWMKISSRDHDNNLLMLFAESPSEDDLAYIKKRFRNYQSVCYMRAQSLRITCPNGAIRKNSRQVRPKFTHSHCFRRECF